MSLFDSRFCQSELHFSDWNDVDVDADSMTEQQQKQLLKHKVLWGQVLTIEVAVDQ